MPSVWVESRQGKRGRTYLVRWETQVSGRRLAGSLSAGRFKAMADKIAHEKLRELYASRGNIQEPRRGLTWGKLSSIYLEHCQKHKSFNTYRNFDSRAVALFTEFITEFSPLAAIGSSKVAEWETALLARFNPNTVRIYMRCIRTAFSWAKREGYIDRVPTFEFPKASPVGRVLSDEEISRLIEATTHEAVRRAIIFSLHTGARRGEVASLAWENIDRRRERWAAVIGGVGGAETKTAHARVIPLHRRAMESMGAPGAGKVFQASNDLLSHAVQDAARRAGLGRVRFHDLRHTWATRFMQKTGDLFALKQIGGWRSMASVAQYQHYTKHRENLVESVEFHTIPTLKSDATVDKTHA